EDEPGDRALDMALESRREVAPELPEDDWQREREPGDEAHLERGHERLGDAERDGVAVRQRQRRGQDVEHAAAERVGDAEARADRHQADDDPCAELAEMVDELRGLVRLEPARQAQHHAASCRSRVTSAGTAKRSGSGLSPVTESLNSRIPLPSERPISGSRFGPKTSRRTTPSKSSSGRPTNPGM